MEKMRYIGCFFPKETVLEKAAEQCEDRLFRTIDFPHVTFFYQPETVPYETFGSEITVTVVSYGCDGDNEAFGVEFRGLPQALILLAQEIKKPHITISVSRNGKPVNSKYITYEPIEPFTLQGVFGGMGTDGKLYTHNLKGIVD